MIKNIKLFPNNNVQSMKAVSLIKDRFTSRGFVLSDDNFDLAIAVGGDGSFLRAAHANNLIVIFIMLVLIRELWVLLKK